MAKIIVCTYMVRYPLGGMLSWALHWAIGFQRMGHEIFIVERANYENACFDPVNKILGNNCKTGLSIVLNLLSKYGLEKRYVFQDFYGNYYGQETIDNVFCDGNLLIDIGNHGAWLTEANQWKVPTVLIDGEPGYTQMKMEKAILHNQTIAEFDYYFSNGANIGLNSCTAPLANRKWQHVYNPIVVDFFQNQIPKPNASLTTIMNWQSHAEFNFEGRVYGQKDVEFEKFLSLPKMVGIPMEIAVAGKNIPFKALKKNNWVITDAHEVTQSVDTYYNYIQQSLGEFSVCKEAYVSTNSGWFSDRSAAYLANSRPVILQDTGFSEHIPCGRGCFAIKTIDEAIAAVEEVYSNYEHQSKWAKEIAINYFDANVILKNFLKSLSIE